MIHLGPQVEEDAGVYLDQGLSRLVQISPNPLAILDSPEQSHLSQNQRLRVLAEEHESLVPSRWILQHSFCIFPP
jgi:hypothetical protein